LVKIYILTNRKLFFSENYVLLLIEARRYGYSVRWALKFDYHCHLALSMQLDA